MSYLEFKIPKGFKISNKKYSVKDFLNHELLPPLEQIKTFKDIEDLTLVCHFHEPHKPRMEQKYWNWEIWQDCEDTQTMHTIYLAFKNGGKQIEKEIVHFLENFYEEYVYPKINNDKLTMYHGMRQLISLKFYNGKPYIHYQNMIDTNHFPYGKWLRPIDNDDTHRITGKSYIDSLKYKTTKFEGGGRRYCKETRYYGIVHWEKELINIFNRHIK